MYHQDNRIRWLVVAHLVLGFVAACVDFRAWDAWRLFFSPLFLPEAVIYSQAALLGVWISMGNASCACRVLGIGASIFYGLILQSLLSWETLDWNGFADILFNGQFLLFSTVLPVIATVLVLRLAGFHRSQLRRLAEPYSDSLEEHRSALVSRHVLAFVALFFAIGLCGLSSHWFSMPEVGGPIAVLFVILTLSLCQAATAVAAVWALLAPRLSFPRLCVAMVATAVLWLLGAYATFFDYPGGGAVGGCMFLGAIMAGVIFLSLFLVRSFGYRLSPASKITRENSGSIPSLNEQPDRLQFSLKALITGAIVAAVLMGIAGQRLRAVLNRGSTIEEIEVLGGSVGVSNHGSYTECTVGLTGTEITDGLLEELDLGRLADLDTLILSNTSVTDQGLLHLQYLANVTAISLDGTSLDGTGLIYFQRLKKLRFLDLSGTKIRDASLVHLEKLNNLDYVRLNNTGISDAGLAYLEALPHLQLLEIKNTKVSPVGIQRLTEVFPEAEIQH